MQYMPNGHVAIMYMICVVYERNGNMRLSKLDIHHYVTNKNVS